MPLGILETSLYADDLEAAERFYGGILGLTVHARSPGRHVFFKCDAQMLLLFAPVETVKAPGSSSLPVPPHERTGRVTVPRDRSRDRFRRGGRGEREIEADFRPSGGWSITRDPPVQPEFAEPRIWGSIDEAGPPAAALIETVTAVVRISAAGSSPAGRPPDLMLCSATSVESGCVALET
jgi:catechol 2,3-dioxygenase-like lactoylglutathione lyase family enzyme